VAELKQFRLPDVGEGLTEADILRWEVKVGDEVVVNQVLVEVETAKAAVELPSPYAGIVHEIHFDEGVTVDVGQPIVTLRVGEGELPDLPVAGTGGGVVGGAGEDLIPTPPVEGGSRHAAAADLPASEADQELQTAQRQSVLVGYGVSGERARRRKRLQPSDATPAPSANPAFEVTPGAVAATAEVDRPVLAKPPVRKLAKTLGVDLTAVVATGPNGTISRQDVQQAAAEPAAVARPAGQQDETRIPIKGVRKHTAAAVVSSAFTAPHVT